MDIQWHREWCEATAPTLTTDDWSIVKALASQTNGYAEHSDGRRIDLEEARALLAYADEVAAGLDKYERVVMTGGAGCWVAVDRCVSKGWLIAAVGTFPMPDDNFTDWGRYIAGRAAALRGGA